MSFEDFYTTLESPLGKLVLTSDGKAITGLYAPEGPEYAQAKQGQENAYPFKEAIKQLHEYFAGKRHQFDLPISTEGTAFQKHVWKALQAIPYGKTMSYADIAKKLCNPKAFRAVGNANGRNPLCIIIPCHRVIAADGGLGGYSSGIETKKWLLEHERKNAA